MPQLDKLAFMGQIFWLLIFFTVFYYTYVRVTIVRLKLDLGFKHFFFQNSNFYELLRKYNKDLLYFFSENYKKNEKDLISKMETMVNTLEKEDKYSIILEIDNSYYEYFYMMNNKRNDLDTNISKQINTFYENFFSLFSVFFVLKRFYVYESMFYLYVYFLEIFLEEKNTLLLSVLPQFNEEVTE